MPRLYEWTAKVQFATAARHPSLIGKAAMKRGLPSNTAWLQRVVCEALAEDLDIPVEELLAELPPLRGAAWKLMVERGKHIPASAREVAQ